MTAVPSERASSNSSAGFPAKKSIHTEVSTTTPATDRLEIDLQPNFPLQSESALVEAASLHLFESFDDRFCDSLPGDPAGGLQEVAGQIGSHPSRRHDRDHNSRMYVRQYTGLALRLASVRTRAEHLGSAAVHSVEELVAREHNIARLPDDILSTLTYETALP